MANRATRNVGLGNLAHGDGGLDASLDAGLLAEILEGQAVDDGTEHAHVVSPCTVDAALGELRTPEVVSAADDNSDFSAAADNIGDLRSNGSDEIGVDTEAFTAGEGLTGELQQHTTPATLGCTGPCLNRAVQGRLNGAGGAVW